MWAVAKYKSRELSLLKENFTKILGESPQFYCPKIKYEKYIRHKLRSYEKFKPKILMHCFTGSAEFAYKLLTLESYFSASGIITFKNSNNLQETFKLIPNDKLLIETDSPYLAPVPLRGKKNEPSYLKHTLEKLAYLKNTEIDKMEKITSQNFNLLFNLK